MQVGWSLSMAKEVSESKGLHFDAYGFATSKMRRTTSSYQSIQGDETGSSYEVEHTACLLLLMLLAVM